MEMRVTYDKEGDAAYIYLTPIPPGAAVRQEHVTGEAKGELILDFDRVGRLLGIEVLGASRYLPPSVIAAAESIGGESGGTE
jgi:uncharacterized protein YuzE